MEWLLNDGDQEEYQRSIELPYFQVISQFLLKVMERSSKIQQVLITSPTYA